MEIEVRYFYSQDSLNDILDCLKTIKDLEFKGRFYEKTDQYNHPMKKYDYYSKKIDGRFRVRRTIGENTSKCMITWKRRLKKSKNTPIHSEEEVEVSIKNEEYDNLIFLIENVLHLSLFDSYERYRSVFSNDDIEIVVDEYPFGLALELENKSKEKDGIEVVQTWVNKLGLDINDAYGFSWDDKYAELCTSQNKIYERIVRFDKEMPQEINKFIVGNNK